MNDSLKGHEVKAPVMTLDNTQLRDHVAGHVRESVEDTLNALLDAEGFARRKNLSAMMNGSALAPDIMNATSRLQLVPFLSECRSCARYPLKLK